MLLLLSVYGSSHSSKCIADAFWSSGSRIVEATTH